MIKKGYIDTSNFYIQESYIGYGRKTDLNKMGLLELKEELKMADKQVKLCKEEIESSDDGVPSFALKEKLQNAEYYKKKVEDKIDSLSKKEAENSGVDAMIADLDRQLKNGTISQEYHDKSVENLNEKRELYEQNDDTPVKQKKEKKHIFKKFKDKLSSYKK